MAGDVDEIKALSAETVQATSKDESLVVEEDELEAPLEEEAPVEEKVVVAELESDNSYSWTFKGLFPQCVRDWWVPFEQVPEREVWPTRLLETSDWVDSYFQDRVKAEIERKGHIEKGIGLVFSLMAPLVGLFGFVVLNADFKEWSTFKYGLAGAIACSGLTLLATAVWASKSWTGYDGYSRGTPDFETLTQIQELKKDFTEQGYEAEAATYAQEEIRDRMVIVNGYTSAINQRANNIRGIWFHRARVWLLMSASFVILSATLHVCDTRMREFDTSNSEEKHVGKQGKQLQPVERGRIEPRGGQSKPTTREADAKAIFKRASPVGADQEGQRGRQKQMNQKEQSSTAKEAKKESGESKTPKAEASGTPTVSKGRPSASSVPAPSVSITLSNSSPSEAKKDQRDSEDADE